MGGHGGRRGGSTLAAELQSSKDNGEALAPRADGSRHKFFLLLFPRGSDSESPTSNPRFNIFDAGRD